MTCRPVAVAVALVPTMWKPALAVVHASLVSSPEERQVSAVSEAQPVWLVHAVIVDTQGETRINESMGLRGIS